MEQNHNSSEEEKKRSVTVITEHNGEKEGEGDHRESRGVSLLIGRHTVSVSNLLENPSDVIHLKVSRGSDGVRLVGIRSPQRELSSLELHELFFDERLLFDRSPQEADVGGLATFHHVESSVDSLFFGYKPLVHLELGNTIFLLSNTVNCFKVLSNLSN